MQHHPLLYLKVVVDKVLKVLLKSIDSGRVTRIDIVDEGEFYQEPPFILITGGGGIGAKAQQLLIRVLSLALLSLMKELDIHLHQMLSLLNLVNLKRKTRARQAFNSTPKYLTGLVKDVAASDGEIFVDSTDAYAGSGDLILGTETISYTSKSEGKFSGLQEELTLIMIKELFLTMVKPITTM